MAPSSAMWCLPTARAMFWSPQVAETCHLAVRRLEWLQENKQELSTSPYLSVDPAPPSEETDVAKLRQTLLDESCPLFDRYRAMFALRNLGGQAAVLALADGKRQCGAACSLLSLSLYRLIQDEPVPSPGVPQLLASWILHGFIYRELLSPYLFARATAPSLSSRPHFSVGLDGAGHRL